MTQLLVAALLVNLAASPVAPALGDAAPHGVAVLFVSDTGGPLWTLAGAFYRQPEASAEVPGEHAFAYWSRAWIGEAPMAAPEGERVPVAGGRLLERRMDFSATPPLSGWPERDHLSVVWHDSGALEVRAGAAARLLSEPLLPSVTALVPGEQPWLAVARASLRVGSTTHQGLVLVELAPAGAARALLRGGTLMLVDDRARAWLVRLDQRRWWTLRPGEPVTAQEPPLDLTWVDGPAADAKRGPTAIRLERADTSMLLERVDALPGATGAPATTTSGVVLVPMAGGGFAGEHSVSAHGLLRPPLGLGL